jgi:multiple sugar transport system ATP-binding protein
VAEITLNNVSKRYADGVLAVKDLDLHIADGEFCILVGPSGCGKTTTLSMIAGLEDVTSGELRIGGELVNRREPKDRDIAMVFQSYALYPHMTVRQNMGFALKLAHTPKSEIKRKVEEVAAILDLTSHLDRKPGNLSGGQRQRVAMGRAIVRSPKAFLMDEPLSNLDAKLRVQMRTEVARLQNRLKVTTVYVTHDQTEAMTLGDRVAVMSEGVLQQYAAPRELYAHPRNLFVAGFIGSPAMNLLEATLADGGAETTLGRIPLGDEVRRALETSGGSRRVVIGFRPEHLTEGNDDLSDDWFSFDADVNIVESVGSDVFVHFPVRDEMPRLAAQATPGDEDAAVNLGADEGRELVARLDGNSAVDMGQARLAIDTRSLQVFSAETGENLLRRVPIAAAS